RSRRRAGRSPRSSRRAVEGIRAAAARSPRSFSPSLAFRRGGTGKESKVPPCASRHPPARHLAARSDRQWPRILASGPGRVHENRAGPLPLRRRASSSQTQEAAEEVVLAGKKHVARRAVQADEEIIGRGQIL